MPGFAHFVSIMLRGNMAAWKDFEEFVVTRCLFADLVPGTAEWVPYVWRCVLLTRTQTELSHVLHVSYVCSRMIHAFPMKEYIVDFANRATQEWVHSWDVVHACQCRERLWHGWRTWTRPTQAITEIAPSR